jgi:hypothetical protein
MEPTSMVCAPPPFAAHIVHSAKLIMYVTFGIVLVVVAIAAYVMYNGRLACNNSNDVCVCVQAVSCAIAQSPHPMCSAALVNKARAQMLRARLIRHSTTDH